MNNKSLSAYFIILVILCAGFIVGAKLLGEQAAYLAQGYMMTPAIAALITRRFFYKLRFKDANLRFGRASDYLKYWFIALGITALSYGLYTLLGAIRWDFSGQVFLDRLSEQFLAAGKDMNDTLSSGLTPQMMLYIFTFGGLTIFNILPGLLTGFGEEFGHRGFMFPSLYHINPFAGLIAGGLIVFVWHLPLSLIIPQTVKLPVWLSLLNAAVLAIGTIFAHMYLAYVYVKSGSIFVTSFAHIAMNNAAASVSYFIVVQNQVMANLGLTLTMFIVITMMLLKKVLVFDELSFNGTSERLPNLIPPQPGKPEGAKS